MTILHTKKGPQCRQVSTRRRLTLFSNHAQTFSKAFAKPQVRYERIVYRDVLLWIARILLVFCLGYSANSRLRPDNPARVLLFNNIASFVHDQLSSTGGDEHAAKRRRVDISSVNGHASSQANGSEGGVDAAATDPVLLEIKDISLSVPQRKKYDLCFTKNFLYARAAGTSVPVQGIVYPWKAIGKAASFLPRR